MRGNFEQAEFHYRQVTDSSRVFATPTRHAVQINLCILLIEAQRYKEAIAQLEGCRVELQTKKRHGLLGHVHLGLAACYAVLRRWSSFDAELENSNETITATRGVDVDMARMAQRGGDYCAEAGEIDRARKAYALAISQWEALGRNEDTLNAQSRLESLNK